MNNKKTNICPICVCVSSLWLILSAGVAWGYLAANSFLIPIALLMGGTVVGIAYLGEKRHQWAILHPQKWKASVIAVGMPIAYFLVTNITKLIVAIELLILIGIFYLLFAKKTRAGSNAAGGREDKSLPAQTRADQIEEQMKDCC